MRRAPRAWALILAGLAAGATVGFAQQQAFRGGVDLVRLPVAVRDKAGALVRGLTAEDFQVFEDGKAQPIAFFAEGALGEGLPLHLGLLLDRSASMESDLRAASTAAIRFVGELEEAVDVTFMDFDSTIRVGRFQPPSYPLLFERIRGGQASGRTALYDAVGLYATQSYEREGQHVLLLYTDGGDSTSSITFGKLQDLLRLGNVLIYSVGYMQNETSSTMRQMGQTRLQQIAHETGGEAFFPTDKKDVEAAYKKILDELQGRYTIGYVPSNREPDGKFRKIEVRPSRPELKGLKMRTRSGYLAPRAVSIAK
jgi:Ca-activated chloride channel family protein